MQYLKKRGHSYYVRIVVPVRLRAVIGKHEYTIALHTKNPVEARESAYLHIHNAKAEMRAAEMRRTPPRGSTEWLADIAADQRAAVSSGRMDEESAEAGMDASAEETLDALRQKYGTDENEGGEIRAPERVTRGVRRAWRVFQGEEVVLLRDQIEQYITEVTPHRRAQTIQDKRRVYGKLLEWVGHDAEVRDVTRKLAGSYVSTVIAKRGKAPKTQQSEVAQLSALWKHMEARGVADRNVWHLMSSTVPKQRRGGMKTVRRSWTEEEQLRILQSMDRSDPMWSVLALGLYTGCRIEEMCELKVTDVHDGALHIRITKSDAGVRKVPIHSVIEPLVTRLAATTSDGYLVPGLLRAGRDNKRSVYLSKRIQWHLRKVLKITDKNFVFHGLRHTFTNACERGGVSESTAKLLDGHSRSNSITYGSPGASYSHGLPLEQLAQEITKVTYGVAVDGFVKEAGSSVTITRRSARRPRAGRRRSGAVI